jgi:hypothetical protein
MMRTHYVQELESVRQNLEVASTSFGMVTPSGRLAEGSWGHKSPFQGSTNEFVRTCLAQEGDMAPHLRSVAR